MKCKDIYEWPESYGDPEWFIHDRFGMFIHFGLFSVAARHEWVMTLEQIGAEGYKKYFDNFNRISLMQGNGQKKQKSRISIFSSDGKTS